MTSFRNALEPGYKARRATKRRPISSRSSSSARRSRARSACRRSRPSDYEADDVIATLAERVLASGDRVVVVSADKDLSPARARGRRARSTTSRASARSTRRACARASASRPRASPTSSRWSATRWTTCPACRESGRGPPPRRSRSSGARGVPDDAAPGATPACAAPSRLAGRFARIARARSMRELATLRRDAPGMALGPDAARVARRPDRERRDGAVRATRMEGLARRVASLAANRSPKSDASVRMARAVRRPSPATSQGRRRRSMDIVTTAEGWLFLFRYFHFLAGITWIGILYYFNFVQTPFFGTELGGTARSAMIARPRPGRALVVPLGRDVHVPHGLDDRDRSLGTTGLGLGDGYMTRILTGGILGTLMWANVWFVIWPAQQVVIKKSPSRWPAAARRSRRPRPAARSRVSRRAPTRCSRSRCSSSWARRAHWRSSTTARTTSSTGSSALAVIARARVERARRHRPARARRCSARSRARSTRDSA